VGEVYQVLQVEMDLVRVVSRVVENKIIND
jgi:hypothetical protein